jgi:AraC-like DNA-binding protein
MFIVPKIVYVFYYKAPYGVNPQPRIIPEGKQDIELIISGRGFFEYENRILEAVPGTILWHGPGEKTIYMNDLENPYECLVLSFDSGKKPPVNTISQWKDKYSLRVFIDNVLTEYHSESFDAEKLSYYIYGELYWHAKTSDFDVPSSKRIDEIQQIKNWIEENYHKDIKMEQLASIADISIPHLHTVFKDLVHQTPYQYIQARRLLEAKKLLATTRLSIKEICAKTGFRDIGNFCRFFKKTTGLTAQQYRALYTDKR